jgi:chromosome segregation ATPase
MDNEDRLAEIERRLDGLEFLLLDPVEQLKRLKRGDSSIDEAVRRATSDLWEIESRIDKLHPPNLKTQLRLLQEGIEKLRWEHAGLEERIKAIETSTRRRRFPLEGDAEVASIRDDE